MNKTQFSESVCLLVERERKGERERGRRKARKKGKEERSMEGGKRKMTKQGGMC